MRKKKQIEILELAIQLELNMSKLYQYYCSIFEKDKNFWWQMVIEEKNHAAILKSSVEFLDLDQLPEDFVYKNIKELDQSNHLILEKIKQFKQNIPTKKEAYGFAIQMENISFEIHFQKKMIEKNNSKLIQVFQKLNELDLNHAQRINNLLA